MTEPFPAQNRALVRDYFAAWDAGDLDAVGGFFADDFSTTYTNWTGEEVRVESTEVHDWLSGWLDTIGGMTHEVHDLVAERDRVMAHITYRGVHEGELFGIEPTGNDIEVEEFLRFGIEDGEIVALDWLGDDLALLRQLGVDLPVEPDG